MLGRLEILPSVIGLQATPLKLCSCRTSRRVTYQPISYRFNQAAGVVEGLPYLCTRRKDAFVNHSIPQVEIGLR